MLLWVEKTCLNSFKLLKMLNAKRFLKHVSKSKQHSYPKFYKWIRKVLLTKNKREAWILSNFSFPVNIKDRAHTFLSEFGFRCKLSEFANYIWILKFLLKTLSLGLGVTVTLTVTWNELTTAERSVPSFHSGPCLLLCTLNSLKI